MNKAWSWTARVPEGQDCSPKVHLLSNLTDCCFRSVDAIQTSATDPSQPGTVFTFKSLPTETNEGELSVSSDGQALLHIQFKPRNKYFWEVPGQNDGVFHFPNISADVTYKGVTAHAFGYCKRYWGDYDGPWGYQFIHGVASDEKSCGWTADATFGDDEYNYFKLVGEDGVLIQSEQTDTYHNNQRAFWRPISGPKRELELSECAKMEFFLRSEAQNSKLVERFGKVRLLEDGQEVWAGFGFNEVCFGTVG